MKRSLYTLDFLSTPLVRESATLFTSGKDAEEIQVGFERISRKRVRTTVWVKWNDGTAQKIVNVTSPVTRLNTCVRGKL